MPSPHVAFNDTIANILKIILDMGREGRPASLKEIAERSGKSPAMVGRLIERLAGDSRKFLTVEHHHHSVRGRPPKIVEIDANQIVTHPLSAWILLALFEERDSLEINRRKFERKVVEKLRKLDYPGEELETQVKERLAFLVKIKDVGEGSSVGNIIWLVRTNFFAQRPYIELLARELKLPLPADGD